MCMHVILNISCSKTGNTTNHYFYYFHTTIATISHFSLNAFFLNKSEKICFDTFWPLWSSVMQPQSICQLGFHQFCCMGLAHLTDLLSPFLSHHSHTPTWTILPYLPPITILPVSIFPDANLYIHVQWHFPLQPAFTFECTVGAIAYQSWFITIDCYVVVFFSQKNWSQTFQNLVSSKHGAAGQCYISDIIKPLYCSR